MRGTLSAVDDGGQYEVDERPFRFEGYARKCFFCGGATAPDEPGTLRMRIEMPTDYGGWISHQTCMFSAKHRDSGAFHRIVGWEE
jgi:hypothetical protein